MSSAGTPLLLPEPRDVAVERTPIAQPDMLAEQLDPAGGMERTQPVRAAFRDFVSIVHMGVHKVVVFGGTNGDHYGC